jgi:Icc-related predicted phosphoesterase
MTWGNHDWIGRKWLPSNLKEHCHVLVDEMIHCRGFRIYGLPWQQRFFEWEFNLDEPELNQKYEAIPECDIIMSHGPPLGYGDYSLYGNESCGSRAFRDKIMEITPKLVVYGHIHNGYGRYGILGRNTILANVSLMDEKYRPVNPPMVFVL